MNSVRIFGVKFSQRNKPKGFFKRTVQTITAPIVSIFRTITFQKAMPPERWYEKAIDALTTAIALNDENKNLKIPCQKAGVKS